MNHNCDPLEQLAMVMKGQLIICFKKTAKAKPNRKCTIAFWALALLQSSCGSASIHPSSSGVQHCHSPANTSPEDNVKMPKDQHEVDGSSWAINPDEYLAANEEWLYSSSGAWVSNSGVTFVLDFRVISFVASGDWKELDGSKFLLGQGLDFMTNTGFYKISPSPDEEGTIVLTKKDISDGGPVGEIILTASLKRSK